MDDRTRQLQASSTQLVLASHVEPTDDIETERRRATFDVQRMAEAINGGREVLEKR
jgi:acyl-CoA oxidase